MKKIAIFSGSIPSSTFIEHLIEGIAEHHKVMLFGVVEAPKTYSSKNITIYKTPFSHPLNFVYTFYRIILLLLKRPQEVLLLLKEVKTYKSRYDRWIWFSKFLPIILYRPDIVHLQWTRDLEFYTFLQKRFHFPLIVSLRGSHINYTPIVEPRIADLYRKTFPHVAFFHAVSKAIALEAQQYGADIAKIKVIHSPIPRAFTSQFKPYKKSSSEVFNLMSVGRFHWVKGFKYALDAVSILKNQGVKIVYTIVGPSKFSEDIQFQIHQLGLEDTVKLLSQVPQADLIAKMTTQDAIVLSSVQEGIANVVLEAMAIGVPVISTDCGGMPEVVVPKQTGWLVPVRNPQDIADAVHEMIQTDPENLERITLHAHEHITLQFDADRSIKQFLELYKTVAAI